MAYFHCFIIQIKKIGTLYIEGWEPIAREQDMDPLMNALGTLDQRFLGDASATERVQRPRGKRK